MQGKFSLRYLFLEITVASLPLLAWRLMRSPSKGSVFLGMVLFYLTAWPALLGMFGPKMMLAGLLYSLGLLLIFIFVAGFAAITP